MRGTPVVLQLDGTLGGDAHTALRPTCSVRNTSTDLIAVCSVMKKAEIWIASCTAAEWYPWGVMPTLPFECAAASSFSFPRVTGAQQKQNSLPFNRPATHSYSYMNE
jgi:hypothetical protein